MKKYLAAIAVLVVFLMISLPFATSAPDGLQRVASSFGIEEPEPFWRGLMGDYSTSFLSELAAGVLGTVIVLLTATVLGTLIVRRNRTAPKKIAANEEERFR